MIVLIGIDTHGDQLCIFEVLNDDLRDQLKIAQRILDKQPKVICVAILKKDIEVAQSTSTVFFNVHLLHLIHRQNKDTAAGTLWTDISQNTIRPIQKNPVEQLDNLITENSWIEARVLMQSLTPLQATHTVLAAMLWSDRTSTNKDWEFFNYNLSGMYQLADVPTWCSMPEHEHQIAGGCWGILHGEVDTKGQAHCLDCEYNQQ